MTAMDTEDIIILEMVEQHEIPCDYADDPGCSDDPATWVMFKVCPLCDERGARLVCETCKDIRMASDGGLICQPGCGEVVVPARHMYSRIEPL